MTRQSRMVLVIGIMAIGGVSALALMANRYARIAPTRSVDDIPTRTEMPAVPDPVETPPATTPVPTAVSPAAAGTAEPEPAAGTAPGRQAPAPAATTDVDRFMAGRRYVKQFLDDHPKAARQFEVEIKGDLDKQDRNPMFLRLMTTYTVGRARAIREAGLTKERYEALRDAFRAWHDGSAGVDPGLAAQFESRRAELEPLHLGLLEPLDDI